MRLLGIPTIIVVVAVFAGVTSACTNRSAESSDIELASSRMRSEVVSVSGALSDVVVVQKLTHLDNCENHGSGSIPPMTKVDLSLREGVTVDDVRKSAEAALAGLGYKTVPGSGQVLVIGRRKLDDKRDIEIRLYESDDLNIELILAGSLTPLITC